MVPRRDNRVKAANYSEGWNKKTTKESPARDKVLVPYVLRETLENPATVQKPRHPQVLILFRNEGLQRRDFDAAAVHGHPW